MSDAGHRLEELVARWRLRMAGYIAGADVLPLAAEAMAEAYAEGYRDGLRATAAGDMAVES